jgi:hypothetical protein
MWCGNCNNEFDLDNNSTIIIKDEHETLIIKCPICKTRKEKRGNKIDENSIENIQMSIFNIK